MSAIVIVFFKHKGGVGCSETVFEELYQASKENDHNVSILALDLDPGATLSNRLLGFTEQEGGTPNRLKKEETSYNCLINGEELPVRGTNYENIDLVPASINMQGIDVDFALQADSLSSLRINRLKEGISKVRDDYDYIFIDCPAGMDLCTLNAMLAGDYAVAVNGMGKANRDGLLVALFTLDTWREKFNVTIKELGIVLTMKEHWDTSSKSIDILQSDSRIKDRIFRTIVPKSTVVHKAEESGKSVSYENRYAPASLAFRDLWWELKDKMGVEVTELAVQNS